MSWRDLVESIPLNKIHIAPWLTEVHNQTHIVSCQWFGGVIPWKLWLARDTQGWTIHVRAWKLWILFTSRNTYAWIEHILVKKQADSRDQRSNNQNLIFLLSKVRLNQTKLGWETSKWLNDWIIDAFDFKNRLNQHISFKIMANDQLKQTSEWSIKADEGEMED